MFIASALYGKELEAHYAPLFAKVVCQPFTCDAVSGTTTCKCKSNGTRGTIQTDSIMQVFFMIVQGAPGKK